MRDQLAPSAADQKDLAVVGGAAAQDRAGNHPVAAGGQALPLGIGDAVFVGADSACPGAGRRCLGGW